LTLGIITIHASGKQVSLYKLENNFSFLPKQQHSIQTTLNASLFFQSNLQFVILQAGKILYNIKMGFFKSLFQFPLSACSIIFFVLLTDHHKLCQRRQTIEHHKRQTKRY